MFDHFAIQVYIGNAFKYKINQDIQLLFVIQIRENCLSQKQ